MPRTGKRILMLLENGSFPEDCRVAAEARALHDAGYRVRVISPTDAVHTKWFEDVNGIATYRYPGPPEWGGLIGYLWEYGYSLTMAMLISLYILLRHGFDVLHVHAPPDMYVMIGACYKLLGKRYVMDHHDLSPELYDAQKHGDGNPWVARALRFFERWSCRAADQLIATNQTQQSIQISRCGVPEQRTNVVRNGPRLEEDGDVALRPELRPPGRTVIGYMGRIGFQDGVDRLLTAVHLLKTDLGREDFLTVIIGDGPAVPSLKQLTGQLELHDFVVFVGYQRGAALRAHLASCDVLTTPDPPSAYNLTCTMIKTMEYMAMSRAIVGFDMPEHRFSAGEASLYAKAGDELDFARCLRQLMDDPGLRLKMGRCGRQRIMETLAWKHQVPHLLRAYEKLDSPRALSHLDPHRLATP